MKIEPAPSSPDAEKAVLGAILVEPYLIETLIEYLKPEHFYAETNRIIYKAMLSLHDEGHAPDSVTVVEHLRQAGDLDRVGSLPYITGLMMDNPGGWLVEQHAGVLVETGKLRDLQQYGNLILGHVSGGIPSNQIIQTAEQELARLNSVDDGKVLADAYMQEAASILDEKMGGYVQTGFYGLDHMLGGLKGVVILAARPSSGKSSMARDITRNLMRKQKKVALLSPDQSGADVFRLEASLRSGVGLSAIKSRQYTLEQADRWRDALRKFREETEEYLLIDDRPLTLPGLMARFRSAARWGASVVIVDYMQLVSVPGLKENEEYATVTAVSKIIKRLSRECGIPALALAQLNRGSEGRSNPRPIMSDLRSSGQIEQDADSIIFIHRPNKHEERMEEEVEFIIEKQKDGPTGIVHLNFKREYSTFLNL